MPDERQQAVHDLVREWLRRAKSDLALANMVENQEIAPELTSSDYAVST